MDRKEVGASHLLNTRIIIIIYTHQYAGFDPRIKKCLFSSYLMYLFELHRWVDGSPVSYTHWGSGEPNNANGEEQCVQMNRHQGIIHTRIQIWSLFPVGWMDTEHRFRLLQVCGTTPTVAESQVTSVRSSLGMTTPTLHPHSPGRETVPKVCFHQLH